MSLEGVANRIALGRASHILVVSLEINSMELLMNLEFIQQN